MADRSLAPVAYRFNGFVLEPAQQRLTDANERAVSLTPKAFDTLLCLVERSGELVTKQELLARVWANVVVEEAILARNVADLRRALGDDSSTPRYIETLPKRGYRFIADVITTTIDSMRSTGRANGGPIATVDTLQLVAASPAQRARETVVEAPEFGRQRTSALRNLGWTIAAVMAAVIAAGIIAWLIWRRTTAA
jgi:DNA-binding winged helix-turn-helix (wHTH) protein